MSKRFDCPNCGAHLEVATRAPMGAGTRRAKAITKLNPNHCAIIEQLREGPMTVRQVQGKLYRLGIKRVSKTGAAFNYHTVQADISVLLGVGLLQMIRRGEELFDPELGVFVASPAPQYFIPEGQLSRVKDLMFEATIGTRPLAASALIAR